MKVVEEWRLSMFLFQNRFFIWGMFVKTMSVRINMAIMSKSAWQVGCHWLSFCFEIEHGSILHDRIFDAIDFPYSLWDSIDLQVEFFLPLSCQKPWRQWRLLRRWLHQPQPRRRWKPWIKKVWQPAETTSRGWPIWRSLKGDAIFSCFGIRTGSSSDDGCLFNQWVC